LAVYFLLHFPADCSGWELPTVLLIGVRTFLGVSLRRGDPGDSSGAVYSLKKMGELANLIDSEDGGRNQRDSRRRRDTARIAVD
jgi:hypothetical protein